jgi:hypothetical protein
VPAAGMPSNTAYAVGAAEGSGNTAVMRVVDE